MSLAPSTDLPVENCVSNLRASAGLGNGQLTLGLICEEMIDLGDSSVEGNNVETVISSIEDQVLAHDGQANEAEISSGGIVSM